MKKPTVENLATIRVVYLMPYTLKLAGIPYDMRAGQSPKHLLDASRETPRGMTPSDWTNDWIDLDHPDASAFVARLKATDDLPRYVHEWSKC